jgi:hypothetical protein
MLLGILAVIGKFFDLVNPWSHYWAGRSKKRAEVKDKAKSDMDDAVKKGDWDAYDIARADKHSSD